MKGKLRVAFVSAVAMVLVTGGLSSRLRAADEGGARKAPTTKPAKKPARKPAKKPAKEPAADRSIIPAGDPWLESVAANTKFSGLVLGIPVTKDDLYGQVILVVYWDQNDKQMQQLLPTFVGLDRRYRSSGLVVIGSTKFHRDKTNALTSARRFGVTFPVYGSVLVPSENLARFTKNPYCFLLDHTGKILYENPPSSRLIGGISAALRRRPNPLLGGKKYLKSGPITAKIRSGRLGDALGLCAKAKSGQGESATDAAELEERLKANAERLLGKADGLLKSDPRSTLALLAQVKKEYAGSEYGKQAEGKLKELSQDKALQNELRAEVECQPILQALSKVGRFPYDGKRADQEKWIGKYRGLLMSSRARLKMLSRKYPDTKAVKEAEAKLADTIPQKPN